jgi:alkylresorcinol/alkylpyrone synthase
MQIAAVGRALPRHYYSQEALFDALKEMWEHQPRNVRRLETLHRNVSVGGRHLALPIEAYRGLVSFTESNGAFIDCALELGAEAIGDGLARAGLAPRDVDHLFFVSVTGIATPSIDARLVNRLGLRRDVKRTPIFGLGCVAGAAGVARGADYLRAFPGQVAVLLSVELCSLTLQMRDASVRNMIASGLFGDGAAAAVMVGAERGADGPRVVATRSVFYPDTERVMGWDVTAGGFRIVLSADVPAVIESHIAADVDAFLGDHGLTRRDITSYVCHPGGPRILEAVERVLGLPDGALGVTWESLRTIGNLSSASVLMVLRDTMAEHRPAPGSHGLMLAMGPGFCSELVLLRW